MAWFVLEFRRDGFAATELDEFPLLEAALKYGIDHLMMMSRAGSHPSIRIGEVKGREVEWLGEFCIDDQGRPGWTTAETDWAFAKARRVHAGTQISPID